MTRGRRWGHVRVLAHDLDGALHRTTAAELMPGAPQLGSIGVHSRSATPNFSKGGGGSRTVTPAALAPDSPPPPIFERMCADDDDDGEVPSTPPPRSDSVNSVDMLPTFTAGVGSNCAAPAAGRKR